MQVFFAKNSTFVNCTAAVASPGVVAATAHGYNNGDRVIFKVESGGALPTGLVAFKQYFVVNKTTNDFEVALTPGGASINFTGSTSGQVQVAKSVDIGATLSNVTITAKYTKADMKADQFGETILDKRVKGIEVNVKTALAEVRDFNDWNIAFPNITRLSSGGDAVLWETKIGEKDSDLTGVLTLHPMSENQSSQVYDYVFYNAVASSESTITYGPSEQAKLEVVWTVLPDFTATPARFFRFGDGAAA